MSTFETPQAILNHAWTYFITDKHRPGVVEADYRAGFFECRYRTPKGDKCIIGCCIPDEPRFDPIFTSRDGIEELWGGEEACIEDLLREVFDDVDVTFLQSLQYAHDDSAVDSSVRTPPRKFRKGLKARLASVAKNFDLQCPT